MRFPARSAAIFAVFVALLGSTYAVAVPAHATTEASSASAAGPAGSSAAPAGRVVAPHVDGFGDLPGDATMKNLAGFFARPVAGRARSDGQCVQNDVGNCRWNYAVAGETERVTCSSAVPICVHYAASGSDAPRGKITADLVLATMSHIYSFYQRSGYRMPEADHNAGTSSTYRGSTDQGTAIPADDVDIYLADIDLGGYYGYCSPVASMAHHAPAFCTLDNDYANISRGAALTNLQVTAAHEFFHAVQFAYDATEDPWFMEGTAVWVEDQVYDAINDNTQYLPYGPLKKPGKSLDKNSNFRVYGSWIFFRWITEHLPQAQGELPKIILSMWQRAAAGSNDHYSLQAVKGALKDAGLPLRGAFAKFAAANRNPAHTYSEGAANHYPHAKPAKKVKLHTVRRVSGTSRIDHLAAATERFVPKGHALKGKHTKLRLRLNMAAKKHGSGAVVTVFRRSGRTKVKSIHLSKSGAGAVTVAFSTKKVKRVELTMTNASTRMNCWAGGLYSCDGQPKDMRVLERYSAQVKH